jgi:hypothetical protein
VNRQPGEEHERSGRENEPGGQDPANTQSRHQGLRDGREADDRKRQRDVGDSGLEG